MKASPQFIVYLVGVGLLGLLYEPVKSALGGQWLFVGCVLAYLVALRLLGTLIAKRKDGRPHD
ncbi:hypothetical protein [Roseateles sp. BYS96W]|uniref:Uncharacterized protein n=1 Tax=Pelomonas nitida TaxID=3299027 RepID=A0ABW7G9L1_9BURK